LFVQGEYVGAYFVRTKYVRPLRRDACVRREAELRHEDVADTMDTRDTRDTTDTRDTRDTNVADVLVM
jgi:hypothetical protein